MSVLNRTKAEQEIRTAVETDHWKPSDRWMRWLLDDLEACISPEPALTINEDALEQEIDRVAELAHRGAWSAEERREATKRILALLQPVDGIVFTRDEAAHLHGWYAGLPIGVTSEDVVLARRLMDATS